MIKPIRDLVYIEPLLESEMTTGGLFKPEQATERCDQGIVKYIGPEVQDLEPGDHVLFPNYTGTLMQIEGEGRIIMMREQDITCTITDVVETIPGLFCMSPEGQPFLAPYHTVIQLMRTALEETDWYKENRQVKKRRTFK